MAAARSAASTTSAPQCSRSSARQHATSTASKPAARASSSADEHRRGAEALECGAGGQRRLVCKPFGQHPRKRHDPPLTLGEIAVQLERAVIAAGHDDAPYADEPARTVGPRRGQVRLFMEAHALERRAGHPLHQVNRSLLANAGNHRIHKATTASVPIAPTTTEPTGPIQAATAPARNSPSWLEAPMNVEFTALTRPRISSGVSSWTSVWRITTLTMSAAPLSASAASDRTKSVDSANPSIARP